MKRCLVYDPYLATLGGGERYVYALAEALESTLEVDLAASEAPDPARLDALQFSVRPVTKMHPLEFPEASAAYDLAVYLTNLPPPPSYAAHSLLVVQFPFEELSGESTIRAEQENALRALCVRRLFGVRPRLVAPAMGSRGDDSLPSCRYRDRRTGEQGRPDPRGRPLLLS